MKKYNKADDFFREALKDHQITPSDAAKKAFMRDVLLTPPMEKKGGKGWILLSALLLLVSAEVVLWAFGRDRFSPVAGHGTIQAAQTQTSSEQPEAIAAPEILNTNTNTKTNTETITTRTTRTTTNTTTKTTTKTTQQSKPLYTPKPADQSSKSTLTAPVLTSENDRLVTQAIQPTSSSPVVIIEDKPAIAPVQENTDHEGEPKVPSAIEIPVTVNPVVADAASNEKTKSTDTTLVPVTETKEKKKNASGRTSPWVTSIGIYYTPEWMFNTLEGTKFINNFGIEGTFHFGNFSVRTGAGVSVGKGTNELVVEYNDFIGAYNQLDSMSFTWNDPTQNYIPTMYTSKKDVWDSMMKLDYPKVVKRYTYLQIPMILGYDFWQTDRISMGARFGPVMSVLLSSKQLSAAYDPGNKKIISINDIAPEQVNLNWQVMAGLSAAIRLTRKMQIEVEPSVRYYFNSVYEKPVNNTKPWSVGVRAAFVVKF